MRTTILPPHLTAQTFASQAPTHAQAAPSAVSADGFEALALKSATPARIIAPRPVEPRPAAAPSPSLQAPAQPASTQPASTQNAQAPDRLLRPGARLDIRV